MHADRKQTIPVRDFSISYSNHGISRLTEILSLCMIDSCTNIQNKIKYFVSVYFFVNIII